MMKNYLISQFDLHHKWYNNALEDLSDAETNQRVHDDTNMNHVKYLAGHLLNAEYNFAKLANVNVEVKWNDLFAAMGQTKARDDVPYPRIEEIKEEWDKIYAPIREGLTELTAEELNEAPTSPFDQIGETRGEALAFLNHHQTYHIGQMGILRKGLGKEPMKL